MEYHHLFPKFVSELELCRLSEKLLGHKYSNSHGNRKCTFSWGCLFPFHPLCSKVMEFIWMALSLWLWGTWISSL